MKLKFGKQKTIKLKIFFLNLKILSLFLILEKKKITSEEEKIILQIKSN